MKSCWTPPTSTIEFFINCLIHIFILFSILTVFFILYISKLEVTTFKKEIDEFIGNEIDIGLDGLDTTKKNALLTILKNVDFTKIKTYESTEAKYVRYNNRWLITLSVSIIVFISILIILLIIILYYGCKMCIDITKLIKENMITFLFVGTIEVLFFLYVATQ